MADLEELRTRLKNLADGIDDITYLLNPDKPTPLFGDVSDYFSREKADGRLPVSFDMHRYAGEIHRNAKNASLDLVNLAGEIGGLGEPALAKVKAYFERNDTAFTSCLAGLADLLSHLPALKGVSAVEMDPYKRAVFTLENTRKVIGMDLEEVLAIWGGGVPEAGSPAPGPEKKGPPPAAAPLPVIKYDTAEAKYLERVYTTAEFIISLNLPHSVRRKYIDVELSESKYSFIRKNEFLENEMRKKVKEYVVSEAGPFPFISLVVFVKEFANMVLLTTLAYNERKISAEFFKKYEGLKQETRDLIEKILSMPKEDMKSSTALVFIRTRIVPVANAWVKEIVNPILAGQLKYAEEIGILANGLVGRVNKIYSLEKM